MSAFMLTFNLKALKDYVILARIQLLDYLRIMTSLYPIVCLFFAYLLVSCNLIILKAE